MSKAIKIPENFDMGEIYMVTSPDGNVYTGQAACYLKSHDNKYTKYGARGRWIGHKSDARSDGGGNCTNLNKEIRLHDFTGFDVVVVCVVPLKELNKTEIKHVAKLKETMDPSKVLNMRDGGNTGPLALSTKATMSANRKIKPCFKQPHTEESKQLIRESLIDLVVRYGHTGNVLPKYVKYINHKDRQGYQLVSHPTIRNKYFTKKSKTLEERYDECIHYMQTAPSSGEGCNNREMRSK